MLPDPKDPTFHNALKAARLAAGLNLSELGRNAGINPAMPGRYEKPPGTPGSARPSPATRQKLNEALGLIPAEPEAKPQPDGSLREQVARLTWVELQTVIRDYWSAITGQPPANIDIAVTVRS